MLAHPLIYQFYLYGLLICGFFTLLLGLVHFFFPLLLDFRAAIPNEGALLRPFKLGPIRYATQRQDVHGIAWIMNHAASYTLVTIGIIDLLAAYWIIAPWARWVAVWIAVWWLLRAASQLYLGRRRGDWWILAGFSWLGLWHLALLWL
jgi:hypothetical protein